MPSPVPATARAESESHSHFTLARRGAREQEVGDVDARDHEHEADDAHQHEQRLSELAPQRARARCAGPQVER